MPKTPRNYPLAGKEKYLHQLPAALLKAFDVNDRIRRYRIENLPPAAWTTKPPDGKGMTRAGPWPPLLRHA
jgi:hypothetical protein